MCESHSNSGVLPTKPPTVICTRLSWMVYGSAFGTSCLTDGTRAAEHSAGEVPRYLPPSLLPVSVGRGPSDLAVTGWEDVSLTWAPGQHQLQAQARGSGLITHTTFSTPPPQPFLRPLASSGGTGTGWALRPPRASLWGSGLPRRRPRPRSTGQAVALRGKAGWPWHLTLLRILCAAQGWCRW